MLLKLGEDLGADRHFGDAAGFAGARMGARRAVREYM
jgi:hypothetical protein